MSVGAGASEDACPVAAELRILLSAPFFQTDGLGVCCVSSIRGSRCLPVPFLLDCSR